MSTGQQEEIMEPSANGTREADAETVAAGAELCRMLLANPVALLDMFIDTLRRARDAAQLPKAQFHAVIIPDVGEASVLTYNSVEELVVVLRDVRQHGGQAFGFRGDLLLPSKGGHYLVTPWGRFPLFAEDYDTEVDTRGYLGLAPPIPKAAPKPGPSVPEDDGDDEMMDQQEEDNDIDVDDVDEGDDD